MPAVPTLIDEPLAEFPARFSQVGLYPEAGNFARVHERAMTYSPRFPLWSNGGGKHRYIVLPDSGAVDVTDPESWQFDVGTLLFKTFDFVRPGGDEPEAVETRILRRGADGWDYVAYVWDEEGLDATLSDMRLPIAVDVLGPRGEAVEHLVPSLRQCRRCHDAGLSNVLGFNELQLNHGADRTALAEFAEGGVFTGELPADPARVDFEDALTQQVVAYAQGNCVHCHNGGPGDLRAFDMRPDVFLQNVIDQPTAGLGSAAGIRVVPGSPEDSILFQAFSGETDDDEVDLMPDVGVQLRDAEAIETFRDWILGLDGD